MREKVRIFSVEKEGNDPAENEDAAAANLANLSFAVADGATDSYDSGRWARLLVEQFTSAPPPLARGLREEWIEMLAPHWTGSIIWKELPWYKEQKAALGAFATFLGLKLDPMPNMKQTHPTGGVWTALAVGDVCLFQLRENVIVPPSPFPIIDCSNFGTTPALVSTNRFYNAKSLKHSSLVKGNYYAGDSFLLMTDALAQWFLCALHAGESPWQQLNCPSDSEFAVCVQLLRSQAQLRNDDMTLLVIDL
jgi:hypothetical protein